MARYWPKFFGLRLRIKERGYYPAILTGKAWSTEDFTLQRKYFALTRIKNIRAKKKKPTVIRAPNKLLRIVYAFSVLTSFYRFLHSNAALSKNYDLLKSAFLAWNQSGQSRAGKMGPSGSFGYPMRTQDSLYYAHWRC